MCMYSIFILKCQKVILYWDKPSFPHSISSYSMFHSLCAFLAIGSKSYRNKMYNHTIIFHTIMASNNIFIKYLLSYAQLIRSRLDADLTCDKHSIRTTQVTLPKSTYKLILKLYYNNCLTNEIVYNIYQLVISKRTQLILCLYKNLKLIYTQM